MKILGHGNIKAKIHRTYTPLKYLLHALQEQGTISKTWIQTTNAPNPRTRTSTKRRRGGVLPGSMALGGGRRSGANPPTQRREGAPRIEIQIGGVRGWGGRIHEEEERGRKNGVPLLYIAQGVRASGSTAVVLAVVLLVAAVVPLGSWR